MEHLKSAQDLISLIAENGKLSSEKIILFIKDINKIKRESELWKEAAEKRKEQLEESLYEEKCLKGHIKALEDVLRVKCPETLEELNKERKKPNKYNKSKVIESIKYNDLHEKNRQAYLNLKILTIVPVTVSAINFEEIYRFKDEEEFIKEYPELLEMLPEKRARLKYIKAYKDGFNWSLELSTSIKLSDAEYRIRSENQY